MMLANLDTLLPSNARVVASNGRLVTGRLTIISAPVFSLNSAYDIGSAIDINATGYGSVRFLKFSVSGTRRIRAASAVTAGSACRLFAVQSFFNASATGFHSL